MASRQRMAFVGIQSDRGLVKPVNQDACVYLEAATSRGSVIVAVVCDGVGGLSNGELASATVVKRIIDWCADELPEVLEGTGRDAATIGVLKAEWDNLMQAACRDIFSYGASEGATLGTTFTGMIVFGGRYLIGHVGDCRVYEVSGGDAVQLTDDQTWVAQQVAAGVIAPEEAAHHPQRHVILQSIGTDERVDPQFIEGPYDPSATYVLCCDGFYKTLEPGDLLSFSAETIASESILQDNCDRLVGEVVERGEKDNITVLAFTEAQLSDPDSDPLGESDMLTHPVASRGAHAAAHRAFEVVRGLFAIHADKVVDSRGREIPCDVGKG